MLEREKSKRGVIEMVDMESLVPAEHLLRQVDTALVWISISDLMEATAVPLGSVMAFTVLPYSTVQDAFWSSDSSGQSSALAMRSSSKVMPGSAMSSRALP